MTTLGALYQATKKRLAAAGLPTPELDAKCLIAHATGGTPSDTLLNPTNIVSADSIQKLDDMLARRMGHEPVSKIIGLRGFYGLDFEVNKHVLDPRPDTETLVDASLDFLKSYAAPNPHILDLCCGTACVGIALASVLPNAQITAADVSGDALQVAARNIARHNMGARINLVQSHWLEGVQAPFDCLVCNPPYIPSSDIAALDDEVRIYDPRLALDGGQSGVLPYQILFPQLRTCLKKGSAAFFECGINQADDLLQMAAGCGFADTYTRTDLGGVVRVVAIKN